MLFEVICDDFKQKRIEFHAGLNTVLGDNEGSNSIGKSTFLLIIDYVFGGDDYLTKWPDVQKNIGFHTIKFAYKFNNEIYRFARDTKDAELIYECDEKYNKIKEISINSYTSFLANEYQLDLSYITFRNIVGRYIRVYGKDNYDEKRPLHVVANEQAGAPVNALLKLFGKYRILDELQTVADDKNERYKLYKKAQQHSYLVLIKHR